MQFILNDRRTYITTIEFRNTTPILNIERIRSFYEEGLTGKFIKKEFRYSFDNITWSPWQTLNTQNLSSIIFFDNSYFYIHIKYTRENVISGNIKSFILTYDSKIISPPSPDSSIINADLLQGEAGEYYLNLWNHYGGIPQNSLLVKNIGTGAEILKDIVYDPSVTSIYLRSITGTGGAIITQGEDEIIIGIDSSTVTEIITGENVGLGDVSIYIGKNLQKLLFRTFKAGSGIILTYDDIETIRIDASIPTFTGDVSASRVFYDTILDPNLEVPNDVGGIPAGTKVSDLYGSDLTSIIDDLLFPTVYPTFVSPSATFSVNPTTTLYEVSAYVSLTFTTLFNRGQILLNSVFQNYRSGNPNLYDYTGVGLIDVDSSSLTNIQNINVYIQQGNNNWTSVVYYDSGPQPYDNKGNPYSTPLPAGSVNASPTINIEGVYPIFATTQDIDTLTKQSLVSSTATYAPSLNGMTLVAEYGGKKQKFKVPVPWIQANPLTGIQTYNTVSGQWEYQGGSAAASLTFWTITDSSENIQGYIIPYKLYTYNSTDRNEIKIRLVI